MTGNGKLGWSLGLFGACFAGWWQRRLLCRLRRRIHSTFCTVERRLHHFSFAGKAISIEGAICSVYVRS